MKRNDYIDKLIQQTEYAMIREVEAAPKPGLVDRFNSGSHGDMTIETFRRSAQALAPWFGKIMRKAQNAPTDLVLPTLRTLGQEAESEMLQVTGGVNTHKGLIFSLGLVCACLVRAQLSLEHEPGTDDIPLLRNLVRQNTHGLTQELNGLPTSHGQTVYATHGLKGIREEAEEGFPAVFDTGLTAYSKYRKLFKDHDLPLVLTLLELLLVTDDTNLVVRGGLEGLVFMQTQASKILKKTNIASEKELLWLLSDFDREAIQRNLSPGGAADNLALTIFLSQVLGYKTDV